MSKGSLDLGEKVSCMSITVGERLSSGIEPTWAFLFSISLIVLLSFIKHTSVNCKKTHTHTLTATIGLFVARRHLLSPHPRLPLLDITQFETQIAFLLCLPSILNMSLDQSPAKVSPRRDTKRSRSRDRTRSRSRDTKRRSGHHSDAGAGGDTRSRRSYRQRSRSFSPDRRNNFPNKNHAFDRAGRGPPAIQGMVSLKVDNIGHRMTTNSLERLFARYGPVGDIYIPRRKHSTAHRGFAFVRYFKKRHAEEAIRKLDGERVEGQILTVAIARYERPDGRSVGGGSGGGAGRGGGRSPDDRRRNPRDRSPDRRRDSSDDRHRRRDSPDRSERRRRQSRSKSASKERTEKRRSTRSQSRSRSKSKSVTRSDKDRSPSRSPKRSPSRGRSASKSASPSPSKSHSRSPSKSPSRSRSRSRDPSDTPDRRRSKSPGSRSASPDRSRSPSGSPARRSRSASKESHHSK